ncbi:LBF_2804 family protein [Leptospira sp. 'Mane']|uniref:LBF_2804 family protein n=1 Tax=Leptospira sp. 'Mane' TaxID=3387407 RepID=UPI00398AB9E0
MKNQTKIHSPGWLEKWGRKVLFSYAARQKEKKTNDQFNFRQSSNQVIWEGTVLSFFIGFIPSALFVYVNFFLPAADESDLISKNLHIAYVLLLILFFTIIEFYLLFKLGLYESYRIAELANIELEDEPELVTPIPGMLARIALEIPDPELRLFGIDPYQRLNRRTLALKTILYKIKVVLSNMAAKFLLKAVIGRGSLRIYIEYISAPITGFWDAYVTFLILKELRMRVITRKIAERIIIEINSVSTKLSENGKLACLQAIANSIVFTKTFHPNFEFLLLKLVKCFELDFPLKDLDKIAEFRKTLLQCNPSEKKLAFRLFLIGSCFDGNLSEEEKAILPTLYPDFSEDDWKSTRELSHHVRSGELKEAISLAEKMMQ